MNRRSFLRRIGQAIVAGALARNLAGLVPAAPAVAFHPDAFKMVASDIGVSMRFVRKWDANALRLVNRFDVLIGCQTPNLACRIQG